MQHCQVKPCRARSLKRGVVMRVFRPCRTAELSSLLLNRSWPCGACSARRGAYKKWGSHIAFYLVEGRGQMWAVEEQGCDTHCTTIWKRAGNGGVLKTGHAVNAEELQGSNCSILVP
eukprot:1147322-Pelagomonas_calceolata.AAC.17